MKKTYAFVAAKMIAVCLSVDDDDGGEKKLRLLSSKVSCESANMREHLQQRHTLKHLLDNCRP
jgi:hypothetical protein